MGEVKPIETYYNGYRFRSRLEARWAVFFDALNIKYEYESEGFQCSDGSKYLPDFYLPYEKYYVEVKGFNDHLINDIKRAERFVLDKKTALLILSNIPWDPASKGLFWFPNIFFCARTGGIVLREHAFFLKNPEEDEGYIQDDFAVGCNARWYPYSWTNDNEKAFKAIQVIYGSVLDSNVGDPTIKEDFAEYLAQVNYALAKARQARFEHGETPII